MRKLILKCGLAPGDIVMLTAAVRDLHRCYPQRFLTQVRTSCPAIWDNNPYLTPLPDDDPIVEELNCSYPLINRCNQTPYHCLHGFMGFLNERLDLSIKPTAFKGDIHLSPQEKTWYSQVYELTREDVPFWIVAAGGKYDVTIKWWQTERYQTVVDHFRGRIQFVQVGEFGHHHPRLEGVIDLRGKTSLRELIRLVYHAQGVLCSVTALMHLAAAVPTKRGHPPNRPCVVVAGGREPAHWEAYPDHQFIHTNGALDCCAGGGCWRDRTLRLRDGDERDRPRNLCRAVRHGLPLCMEMISPAEVIRRIELYFEGGTIRPLTAPQHRAATRAVITTARNRYNHQPLNIHSAGLACEAFIQSIKAYPGRYEGRGIVICAGGLRYLTSAWVCINMLRRLGCHLPIHLWYLGQNEKDRRFETLLAELDVRCIDALEVHTRFPVRILRGWELKPYALLHSPFRQVLLLDADNVPIVNPEFLFDTPQFQETGAVFWPDYPNGGRKKAFPIWRSCGLRAPREPEFETGQILVDKERSWRALCLALWFNENSDFYYRHLHGDKETFHLAFRKLRSPYALVPKPVHPLPGTMCQHDFEDRRIFQHRNSDKWDFFLSNPPVADFRFELECRQYIKELQSKWDGGLSANLNCQVRRPQRARVNCPSIQGVMISCSERTPARTRTLENLARTDWGDAPLHVQLDEESGPNHRERQTQCALNALKYGLDSKADYILFMEDDLEFNQHLRHNLLNWKPLRAGIVTLGSLYNPKLAELACDVANNARIIAAKSIFGSQAFLVSRSTAQFIVRNWRRVSGLQDIRISRLAGRLNRPILYHAPSLVQHIGTESVWGGKFHQALDFSGTWRASGI